MTIAEPRCYQRKDRVPPEQRDEDAQPEWRAFWDLPEDTSPEQRREQAMRVAECYLEEIKPLAAWQFGKCPKYAWQFDRDEMVVWALLAVADAVPRWNPLEKPFWVFVRRRALFAIIDGIRESLSGESGEDAPKRVGLSEMTDEAADALLESRVQVAARVVPHSERAWWEQVFRSLPPRARSLMYRIYAEELSVTEAGAKLGMSQQSATGLHRRSIRTLKASPECQAAFARLTARDRTPQ